MEFYINGLLTTTTHGSETVARYYIARTEEKAIEKFKKYYQDQVGELFVSLKIRSVTKSDY